MVYGIGGMRPWRDPEDPRTRIGPRPMGSVAPGMPGFGDSLAAYTVQGPSVVNVRTGEASPAAFIPGVAGRRGAGLLVDGRSGVLASPLQRVDTSAQLPIRVQTEESDFGERSNPSIRDVLRRRANSVKVTDPALFVGSVADGTARPGKASQTLTYDDLVRNQNQTAGGSIGVSPQEAVAVYRDLIDPPNVKGRRLHPLPGQPNTYGLFRAGDMFVDPTDRGTNLPSDVPLRLRGRAGVGAAERSALGTDVSGFSGEDPSRVRSSERTGRRPVGAISGDDTERAVPIAVTRADGTLGVVYIDPTAEARNIDIPIDQRLSAYNSDAQDYETVSALAAEIRRQAKPQLMPRSALVGNSRFTLAPEEERKGSLLGYLAQTNRDGNRMVTRESPVHAPVVNRAGDPLTMDRDVPDGLYGSRIQNERAFRVGSATNLVDVDGYVRPELAQVLSEVGLPVRRGMVPAGAPGSMERDANMVRLGDLEEMLRSGLTIRQAGAPADITPQELRQLAASVRMRPSGEANPLLYVTQPVTGGAQGPAQLVDTLLPEVQQNPRVMTGSFVRGVEGEIGPAVVNSSIDIRRAAEEFLKRQGSGDVAGLSGLLSGLAAAGTRPPQSGLDAPASASPFVQMLARQVAPVLGGGTYQPSTRVALAETPGGRIASAAQVASAPTESAVQLEIPGPPMVLAQTRRPLDWIRRASLSAARFAPGPEDVAMASSVRPGFDGRAVPVAPGQLGLDPRVVGQVPPGVAYRLMTPGTATVEQLSPVLPAAGSHGARILAEDIHGYLQGSVPMSQIVQGLQLQQRPLQPMGRVMPDPMAPQGPVSTYYPGGVAQAPLQQQAAGQVIPALEGDARQLAIHRAFRGPDGELIGVRPMTGGFSGYTPSYLDDVAAYMAANAPAARIVDRTPQGTQLELDLAGATARGGQLELPVMTGGSSGYTPSYIDDVAAYMAARAPAARIVDRTPQGAQLGVPFRDITGEVVSLPPALIGRNPGPYATSPIYRTALDRSLYQSSLSGSPGFDYADMARRSGAGGSYGPVVTRVSKVQDTPAGIVTDVRNVYGPSPDNLGMEVGSPEQERALAQLAMRIRARQQGLS